MQNHIGCNIETSGEGCNYNWIRARTWQGICKTAPDERSQGVILILGIFIFCSLRQDVLLLLCIFIFSNLSQGKLLNLCIFIFSSLSQGVFLLLCIFIFCSFFFVFCDYSFVFHTPVH